MSEKRLTPMREHIEWLEEEIKENRTVYRSALIDAKYQAMQRLEKEREAIMNAYNQGFRDGEIETYDEYSRDVSEFEDANRYFNETFKTKTNE